MPLEVVVIWGFGGQRLAGEADSAKDERKKGPQKQMFAAWRKMP